MKYYSQNAQLALDTINQKPTVGIPTGLFHIVEHSSIEKLANVPYGQYKKDPHGVYIRMLGNVGVNIVGQYMADNPLTIGNHGYEHGGSSATTGVTAILDGIIVDSPEAVAEHLESFALPHLQKQILNFDPVPVMQRITLEMSMKAALLDDNVLIAGFDNIYFPQLQYEQYGYENFMIAYALYPELFEKLFKLQGRYGALHNKAVADVYLQNDYPLYQRLDHDMADSRSMLVSIKSLEELWFPNFRVAIKPALDAGFKLIWHCDGNLLALFPYLLEAGIKGFQGFQYEDGMDYQKICAMNAKDGSELIIMAGISVTRTLPFGKPQDIANEMKFLIENGPKTGLFLATSSSCMPGTPWENIKTMVEGFQYYRTNGRR